MRAKKQLEQKPETDAATLNSSDDDDHHHYVQATMAAESNDDEYENRHCLRHDVHCNINAITVQCSRWPFIWSTHRCSCWLCRTTRIVCAHICSSNKVIFFRAKRELHCRENFKVNRSAKALVRKWLLQLFSIVLYFTHTGTQGSIHDVWHKALPNQKYCELQCAPLVLCREKWDDI